MIEFSKITIAILIFIIWLLLLIIARLYFKLETQPKTLEEFKYKLMMEE